ncbi:MAG: M1 family aminopeptidase [Bacteroidota bacterium]
MGALLCFAVAGCGSEADDGVVAPAPQPGVDVRQIEAEIRLDPETLRLGARAALDVAHPDTLPTLALGLDDVLEVRTVRVDGEVVPHRREADALYIPLDGGKRASQVEVVYRGVPETGAYRAEAAGQSVVYTDGWPDRTAGWLPGVHHPSDPARLDLTLVVPEAAEVVASGVQVLDSLGGGSRHARFVLDEDSPLYTLAFAVADFEIVSQAASVPVRHALLAADAPLASRLDRTPAVLDTLAALFGPYPYDGYATVQVPMRYAGMENAAAPFLRADLYGATATGRNPIEEVNIHEAVHQWWGNAVVPADWRDLWLAEGPATYFTVEVYARLDGPAAGRRHLTVMSRTIERDDAVRALVPPAYDDPEAVLTRTVYNKGGAVLHLLRLTLGDDVFWPAMRQVVADFADRPLATADFQQALEAASGRSLDDLFRVWVFGEGLPTLRTRWDRDTRTLAWEIEGDEGTLDRVPFELYVRQGDEAWFVPATDGVFSPPGGGRPEVEPVGILLDVD